MSQAAINLAKVTQAAIRTQQRRLKAFENDEKRSERDFNDALKVMAQLVGQARALTKDAVRWSQSLTPEQIREVIAGWFEGLPVQQQKLMLQELLRLHNGERQSA